MNFYQIANGQLDVFINDPLDLDTLYGLFETIGYDPEFNCEMTQFWHIETNDCSGLQSSSLADLGHALKVGDNISYPPVAFIAKTDLLFGMCRAYAAWLGNKPIEVGVFRDYDAALDWAYPPDPICSAG